MTKNIHGTTVDLLGAAIVAGRYTVGALLPPEPLLCTELGVSRTVVCEAVKSLIAKGLLVTGPKVGTRVLPEEQSNCFDADVVAWQLKALVFIDGASDDIESVLATRRKLLVLSQPAPPLKAQRKLALPR